MKNPKKIKNKSNSDKIDSYQIVLAGVGGQGIIYINRVLSKATMDLGYKVYCLEEHGMARRGGSVASYMRFGHEIYTPVIPMGTADLMIGFEVIEAVRQLPVLKSDTTIILNPHIIRPFITTGEYPDKTKLLNYLKKRFKNNGLIIIDAEQIATDLGSSITMNMVLLGAVSGAGVLPIPESSLKDAIKNTSLPQYLDINIEAFQRGFEAAKKR
jgi:indolepyruvate ferredoxin oxidoreductase beta subunit